MPYLQRLDLRENSIVHVAPLSACPYLTMLDLSFNCVSHLSYLEALAHLGNLQQLHMAGNSVENHSGYVLHLALGCMKPHGANGHPLDICLTQPISDGKGHVTALVLDMNNHSDLFSQCLQ